MSRFSFIQVVAVLFAIVSAPAVAGAQVFGTFTWQMQPYCNRVTLTLTGTPGGFVAAGTDDLCGAPRKAGATGFVAFNPDGTVGLTLAIVAPGGAITTNVSATVDPVNGQGAWADSAGSSGAFALGGSTGGRPVRPTATLPIDIADNPAGLTDPCFTSPLVQATLCGVSASHWSHGGLGMPGLQVWKDADGHAHIRGSVVRTGTFFSGSRVFVLPAGLRPRRTLAFTVGMSRASQNLGGHAMVVIHGPNVPGLHGVVGLQFETDAADRAVHFGEIVFSVDR